MKHYWKLMAAGLLTASMAACSSAGTSNEEPADNAEDKKTEEVEQPAESAANTSYTIHVKGDDWGCGVDKVIVNLGKAVDSVDKDTFKVSEHKQDSDWSAEGTPVILVDKDREVLDAYLCDADGNKVDGASEYAALELYISPSDGSPFLYTVATGYNTWSNPYEMTITLGEGKTLKAGEEEISELTVTGAPASKTTDADPFTNAEFKSSDGYTIPYATWTPEEESTTLFVWLHGMGEGGANVVEDTNWMVPILANEVTAYIGEDFQKAIGGANVLVPQSPSFWMEVESEGEDKNPGMANGTSIYTESLHELINKVKEETKSEKVVISGCSNGGYMTVVLAMNYGDEYTAYVPICEAVNDTDISDEQIAGLAQLPMYFIWAENDDTVDPATHEVPTVERILAAGAANCLSATTPDVHDTTDRFKGEDGNPHQYSGHWSWITFDNGDAVTADGVKAWDWIGEQVK